MIAQVIPDGNDFALLQLTCLLGDGVLGCVKSPSRMLQNVVCGFEINTLWNPKDHNTECKLS